ncbi:MAG TPA: DsrE/DsrF/DrsH-like family protein [Burkholderiales bacterium]|nr:DsrE/DsrF/DrsH-like family protein [Burkholderiales bacterium]
MAKISIMVVSGTRERLQMAGMVASVGAVSGDEVTVFLSMNALGHFVKGAPPETPAEGAFGNLLESKKAPPFKDLFRSAAELGDARIHPCSMACDILGVERKDLEPYLQEPLGLTKFLSDAEGAQVYTF